MNYNFLRYFSVLAELEHYTLAAAQLEISQPSLSAAIRSLEEELGVPLFEKHGRNIRLTEYGVYFRDHVDKALLELSSAAETLRRGHENERTHIRIGYVSSALERVLIPQLRQYVGGDQQFTFSLTEGSTPMLIEMLRRESLDMVVCGDRLKDRTLHFQKLGAISYCVCVPKGHPLTALSTVDMQTLRNYPLIGYNNSAGSDLESRARTEPSGTGLVCEVTSASAGLSLAEAGVGLVVVPDIPAFHRDTLVRIPVENFSRSVYLCTLHDKWLEPPIWEFAQRLAGTPLS